MTTAALMARLTKVEAQVEAFTSTQPVPDAVELMTRAGMPPDAWQRQVLQSSEPRILLNCCRQSGKSVVAAALALGTALAEPGALVLVLSPSLRQSQESFRKVLDLYRTIHTAIPTRAESALRMELGNGSRIISLPGTEATVRGYSQVRLLVVDEASRVLDPLYYAIRPVLSVSQGRLIALSTPFGARGWWYQEWTEGAGWERVRITAEQCPRISPPFLEEERRTLPPLWFQSEYECRFVDTVDQVFSTELLLRAMKDDIDPLWADEDDPWALSSA
jgi:hypothetical protein